MSFLDLHVELAVTNDLLRRIADALDRLSPLTTPPDHSQHPLIGLADVSRFTSARACLADENRATLPLRASERVRFGNKGANDGETAGSSRSEASASVTGAWDHEDPLDNLEEFDREWPNYAGTDV